MNLTNSQKRKILNDAPIGAEYYSEVSGGTYLMRSMALSVSFVFVHRPDGWKQALDKLSDWGAINLDDLQKEVDAEDEAQEAEKRRISFSKGEMREIVENAPKWATLYRFSESCGHEYVRDYQCANPELKYINVHELKEQVNRDDLAMKNLELKWPKARLEKKIKNQRGEINRLNGIIAKLKCKPKKVINIDYEYDSGMRNAMKKVARLVDRSFCVDVGYEDLPDLVKARLVMFRCENKELKMQLGRKKTEIKRLHDEANESKGEWQNGDKCVYVHKKRDVYLYVGRHPKGKGHYVYSDEAGVAYIAHDYIEKPQAEEQKAVFIAEEKAIELCKALCDICDSEFDWEALPEEKKQGYRNMIKAGVVVNEKAAK